MSDTTDRERAALERGLRERAEENPLREQMLAFVEKHDDGRDVTELREELSGDESMAELVVDGRRE